MGQAGPERTQAERAAADAGQRRAIMVTDASTLAPMTASWTWPDLILQEAGFPLAEPRRPGHPTIGRRPEWERRLRARAVTSIPQFGVMPALPQVGERTPPQ